MPLPFAAFFAGKSIGQLAKIFIPVALVLGILIAAIVLYNKGQSAGEANRDNQTLRGNAKTLENTMAANNRAADTRLSDAERQQQEQAELGKAVSNATSPAERRRAFHRCLRDQQAARAANRPAPSCS